MSSSLPGVPKSRAERRRDDILQRLRHELAADRLVVITGAGVTMNALTDTSGNCPPYTSWKGLIIEGLDYLVDEKYLKGDDFMVTTARTMISQGDLNSLLLAATILKTQLEQRSQYATWLNSVFGTLKNDVQSYAILDILKRLHEKKAILLTTNYDDLLDKYCGLDSFDRSHSKQVQDFKDGVKGVFHVHGYYKNPEAVVLDIKDYFTVQQSGDARNILETFLEWKTILFVGCGEGVNDPNFHTLLDWASDKSKKLNRANKHVVLLRDGDPPSHDSLVTLTYGRNFSELGPFIARLLESDAESASVEGHAQSDGLINGNIFFPGEERLQILKWLNAKNQSKVFIEMLDKREPETGSWFLQGEEFATWKIHPASLLWLSGSVGCGKTILCSSIIENLKQAYVLSSGDKQRNSLAYFYCSFRDDDTKEVRSLLKALICQLCPPNTVPSSLRELYSKCQRSYPLDEPLTTDLRAALCDMIAELNAGVSTMPLDGHMFIIIDALDEVPRGTHLDSFLKLLRYITSFRFSKLHILMTSRHQNEIQQALSFPEKWQTLLIDRSPIGGDIQKYVSSAIDGDVQLCRLSPATKMAMKERLADAGSGMFQWAALQMERIRAKRPVTDDTVKFALQTLPKDLNETYERLLAPIDPKAFDQAFCALQWLICSSRPLFIEELIDACSIRLEANPNLITLDKARRLGPHQMQSLLDSLVKIFPPIASEAGTLPQRTHTVTLAHFSVQEFLTGEDIVSSEVRSYLIQPHISHRLLATSCLLYLYYCNCYAKRNEYFPLRRYAWYNWERHVLPATNAPEDPFRRKAVWIHEFMTEAQRIKVWSDKEAAGFRSGLSYEHAFPLAIKTKEDSDLVHELILVTNWIPAEKLPELLDALNIPYFMVDYDQFSSQTSMSSEDSPETAFAVNFLPLEEHHIRLVSLLPALNADGDTRAKIELVNLKDAPVYDALSYSWEWRRDDETKVWVKGKAVSVTQNLGDILRNLRRRHENASRRLWVDSLSINMADKHERSTQVLMMGDIYKQAHIVVVGLGQKTGLEQRGCEFLEELALTMSKFQRSRALVPPHQDLAAADARISKLREGVFDKSHRQQWLAASQLFQRSWWTRSWIVQEIVMAGTAMLIFGDCSLNLDVIERLVEMEHLIRLTIVSPQENDRCCNDYGCSQCLCRQLLSSRGWMSAERITHARSLLRKGDTFTFPQLLATFVSQESTHPSDKVYALLSLAPEPDRRADLLRPDYTLPSRQVYSRLGAHLLISNPNLDLLSFVSHWIRGEPQIEMSWPFWIPSPVGVSRRIPLFQGIFNGQKAPRQFMAGGAGAPQILSFSHDHSEFKLQGVEIDTIRKKFPQGKSRYSPRDRYGMVDYLDQQVYPSQEFEEIECRSILADQDPSGARLGSAWEDSNQDLMNKLECGVHTPSLPGGFETVYADFSLRFLTGRQLFVSEKGYIGLAPIEAQVGDIIVVCPGGAVPYVLRTRPSYKGETALSAPRIRNSPAENASSGRKRKGSPALPEEIPKPERSFNFMGECYVHGIMDGEIMAELAQGKHQLQTFCLH